MKDQTSKTGRPTEARSDDHAEGPEGAPITLIEYGDFECPFARRAVDVVKDIQGRWAGQIRFVFRHFPLQDLHPRAFDAALAAEAAGMQGAFWEMFTTLFREQGRLARRDLERHAEGLGLDVAKFREALDAPAVRARVERDLEEGGRLGVHSTPTFLVNGRLFEGSARDLPDVVAAAAPAGASPSA